MDGAFPLLARNSRTLTSSHLTVFSQLNHMKHVSEMKRFDISCDLRQSKLKLVIKIPSKSVVQWENGLHDFQWVEIDSVSWFASKPKQVEINCQKLYFVKCVAFIQDAYSYQMPFYLYNLNSLKCIFWSAQYPTSNPLCIACHSTIRWGQISCKIVAKSLLEAVLWFCITNQQSHQTQKSICHSRWEIVLRCPRNKSPDPIIFVFHLSFFRRSVSWILAPLCPFSNPSHRTWVQRPETQEDKN